MTTQDTTDCEAEPIRYPGTVQPHGGLLVLQAETAIVEAASLSCEGLLGVSAASLLGQPLSTLFGAVPEAAILSCRCDGLQPPVHLAMNGRDLYARAMVNEARQVLVDIETADTQPMMRALIYQCRRDLAALRRMIELPAITQEAAQLIRGMTGFERVMIYRFDAAWNGEVIAEARGEDIEPYLGLSFPASDIPQPARELFQASKVRQIPDALYTPSDLIARGDRRAFDLGPSSLRSVSPLHVEYLTNMGVRASLAGALVIDGRMWGLVACHHQSGPKYFGPGARDTLGWLCDDIAALIGATLTRQRREREFSLATRRRHLVDAIRRAGLSELMQQAAGADLLDAVGADGFALLADDSVRTIGSTPGADRIRELQGRRRGRERDPTLFASSALTRDLGVDDAGDGVAGAVFVSLRARPHTTMIWFRQERVHSVRWAGDPEHPHLVADSGRISPRKSFAAFLRSVRGQCLAWTEEEQASAAELGSLIEIEALREEETRLENERIQLRILLHTLPDLVWLKNLDGVYLRVNLAWQRFFGHRESDIVGKTDYDFLTPGLADKFRQRDRIAAASAGSVVSEEWFASADEGHGALLVSTKTPLRDLQGAVIGVLGTAHDITKRRAAEAELEQHRHHLEELVAARTTELEKVNEAAATAHRANVERLRVENEAKIHSQKLEAVGTLAAGIAHDFNNILGSIVGYAEMTIDGVPQDSNARRNVGHILGASFRARDLVARMLTFARQTAVNPTAVDLAAQVRDALALLRASLPPSIGLSFESGMDEASATILADPAQITQIVMNLCINAADAMDGRGTVGIHLDSGSKVRGAPPPYADAMCLRVTDSGSGMTPEVQARLFDPFFTTKAPGKGTGLGLSVVYGVVTGLGGVIEVQSSVSGSNRGTEFRVFLPRSTGP